MVDFQGSEYLGLGCRALRGFGFKVMRLDKVTQRAATRQNTTQYSKEKNSK